MKKLFLMMLLASVFSASAQSDFNEQKVTLYLGQDTMVVYNGLVRVETENFSLVETPAAFYINERCTKVHLVNKKYYLNNKFGYVTYEVPGEYIFWVKYGEMDGKIQFFHYTNFKNYTTIQY